MSRPRRSSPEGRKIKTTTEIDEIVAPFFNSPNFKPWVKGELCRVARESGLHYSTIQVAYRRLQKYKNNPAYREYVAQIKKGITISGVQAYSKVDKVLKQHLGIDEVVDQMINRGFVHSSI